MTWHCGLRTPDFRTVRQFVKIQLRFHQWLVDIMTQREPGVKCAAMRPTNRRQNPEEPYHSNRDPPGNGISTLAHG